MADPNVTERSFPFATGQGANVIEDDWASMAGAWQDSGVLGYPGSTGLTVVPGPTQNTVQILAGTATIGGFFYRLTAPKVLPTLSNPNTVNRIDLVALFLDRANEQIVPVVLSGTALSGISPGYIPLSEWAQLPASAATGSNWGFATDKRWFAGSRMRPAIPGAEPPAVPGGFMFYPQQSGLSSIYLGTASGSTAQWTKWSGGPGSAGVNDYGAKGDGVANDQPAIQAAIDAVAAKGGGVVLFPPGTYVINTPITVKTGVTIQGAHGSGWPFRFPASTCQIMCSATFSGEAAVSMLGADITGLTGGKNEGSTRILDIDIAGDRLPAGSVTGVHAQGEVMDVVMARVSVRNFTHNGIHTNVGTGTKAPHDWFMDQVISYHNASYGFSLSMTDGFIRNSVASSNTLDGWLLGPLGSLTMEGCQALFNTNNGFTIAGGNTVGNLSIIGLLTDRNGHDGLHLGASSGAGAPPIVLTGTTLNRDGRNGNTGGGAYAGLRIDACANPVIISGLTVNTGVDDDSTGTNSPQYGVSLTGANAYVSINGGYVHGNTAGIQDDGATVVLRRFNVDEATGPKATPTLAYGNGPVTDRTGLALPGLVTLKDAATPPAANPASGVVAYSQGGQFKVRTPTGPMALTNILVLATGAVVPAGTPAGTVIIRT